MQQQLNDQQKAMELLQEQLDRVMEQKEVRLLREQLDRVMVKLAYLQANTTRDDSNNMRQKEPNRSEDTQLTVATPKKHPGGNYHTMCCCEGATGYHRSMGW